MRWMMEDVEYSYPTIPGHDSHRNFIFFLADGHAEEDAVIVEKIAAKDPYSAKKATRGEDGLSH